MSWRCDLLGHKWDRPLSAAEGLVFCRIDCERCGFAIDAVPLVKLRDEHPELWNRIESKMPR